MVKLIEFYAKRYLIKTILFNPPYGRVKISDFGEGFE